MSTLAKLLLVVLATLLPWPSSAEGAASGPGLEKAPKPPRAAMGPLDSPTRASLLIAGTMRGFTLAERSTPPRGEADYSALAGYGGNLARIGVLLDVDAGLTKFSMSQLERNYMQTTVAMAEKRSEERRVGKEC